jgi:exodeoxyribonuclease VII small subunit
MDEVTKADEKLGENNGLTDLTFEAALQRLEETVARLEAGELTLEEALELFETGQRLAQYCNSKLESADLKLEQLTSYGEIAEVTLD